MLVMYIYSFPFINLSFQLLKRNQQRAAGSVIILVSQGTVSSTDLEASLELLREEEVTLAAIEYPSLGETF